MDGLELRVEKVEATKDTGCDVLGDVIRHVDLDCRAGERVGRGREKRGQHRGCEKAAVGALVQQRPHANARSIRSLSEPASMYSMKMLTHVWVEVSVESIVGRQKKMGAWDAVLQMQSKPHRRPRLAH